LVDFNAKPGESFTAQFPDLRGIFSNTRGKDQYVQSAEDGKIGAYIFLAYDGFQVGG